jgi:chromosome segregation ATPase
MAVSLVIIALASVVIAVAFVLAARETRQISQRIETLRGELEPALRAVEAVSGEGQRLATLVGREAEELVQASRRLRGGLRERLVNLEAVYEVLEEEVEETALDLAVSLRNFRRGAGWFARLRRLLGGRRRR